MILAQKDGKIGFIPPNYVQIIQETKEMGKGTEKKFEEKGNKEKSEKSFVEMKSEESENENNKSLEIEKENKTQIVQEEKNLSFTHEIPKIPLNSPKNDGINLMVTSTPSSPPKIMFVKSPIKKLIKKSSLNKPPKGNYYYKSMMMDPMDPRLLNLYQPKSPPKKSLTVLPSIDSTSIKSEMKKDTSIHQNGSPKLQRKNTLIIKKNFMRRSMDHISYVIAVEDYLPDESEKTKLTVRKGDLFKVIEKEKGFFFIFFFCLFFFFYLFL